jgi:hypothetical protein
MHRSARQQRGMGLLGIIFWIAVVSSVVSLAVKLVPAYTQFATVKAVMNGLQSDRDLVAKGPREVISVLFKRLGINEVKGVGESDFKVEQTGSQRDLVADYEVRVHLISNIDVLMKFDHKVALPRQ